MVLAFVSWLPDSGSVHVLSGDRWGSVGAGGGMAAYLQVWVHRASSSGLSRKCKIWAVFNPNNLMAWNNWIILWFDARPRDLNHINKKPRRIHSRGTPTPTSSTPPCMLLQDPNSGVLSAIGRQDSLKSFLGSWTAKPPRTYSVLHAIWSMA